MANSNQYVFYLNADVNQFNSAMRQAQQKFTDVQQTVNKGLRITVDKSNVEGLKTVVDRLTHSMLDEARAIQNVTDYTNRYNQATKMQSDFLRQYEQKIRTTSQAIDFLNNTTDQVAKTVENKFLDSIRKISRDGDLSKVMESWNGAFSKTEQEILAASRVTVQYKDANGQLIEAVAVLNRESQSYDTILTRVISSRETELQVSQKQAEALRKESDHVSEVIRKYTELGTATARTNSQFAGNLFQQDISSLDLGREKALAAQSLLSSGNLTPEQFESIRTLVQGLDSDLIQIKGHIAEVTRTAEEAGARLPMSLEKAEASAVKLDESFNKLSVDIDKQKDKYGSNTFAALSGGVRKAQEDLRNLNAVFARTGDVDAYITGVSELKTRLASLKAEFTRTKANATQLPMTMEQARGAVVSLGEGFAKLSQDIERTRGRYVDGTFNTLSNSLTNARATLNNLTIAFQNGRVSEEAYGNAILLLISQLDRLQAEFEQTKDSGTRRRTSEAELTAEYDRQRAALAKLQTEIRNAEGRGYARGAFAQVRQNVANTRTELERLNQEFQRTHDIDAYERGLQRLSGTLGTVQADVREVMSGAPQSGTRDNFFQNMGKYARWYFGGNLITSARRMFSEALTEIREVDTELVQVKKVTDMSSESLKRMGDNAYEVGKKYGVAASEYLNAVAAYSRAGMKDAAEDLAELSVKASLVGDMAQDNATSMFLAIQKAYDTSNSELSLILDGLNELDNKHATTIEDITEGLGKVASIASVAHVGYDELAASIGTITAVTQRSGTEAATALRALFLNIIGDTKTEIEEGETATIESINNIKDALKKYAPDVVKYAEKTKTIIDPLKAIEALATAYNRQEITEQKLMEILSSTGGKLRTGQLTALITHWDEYTSQLEDFNHAFGSADKEVNNALDSWERKTQILRDTWTDFIQKSIKTDFIKGVIDALTQIVNMVGSLGNLLGIVAAVIVGIKLNKIATGLQTAASGLRVFISSVIAGTSALSMLQAAILGVTAVIGAYIMYSNAKTQRLQKEAEESAKLANIEKEETERLNELFIAYNSAADGSKKQKDASEELAKALGVEKDAVKDLTEEYVRMIHTQAESDRAAAFKARGDAGNVLKDAWNKITLKDYKSVSTAIMGKLPAEAAQILELAARRGKIKLDRSRNGSAMAFTATDNYNAESIRTFLEVLDQVQQKTMEIASAGKEGFDDSIFDEKWWVNLTAISSRFKNELNSYQTEYKNWLRAKAVDDFYTAVEHGALKSSDALGKYIMNVRRSTEYSQDMKDMLIEMAMSAFYGTESAADAIEETANNLEEAANEAERAASAVQRYKDAIKEKNTDALEEEIELFKQVREAAKKGQYGSVEFQYGMQALLSEDKYREFSNKQDWEGMYKYVNGMFGKSEGLALDAAPIGFFKWLADNHGVLDKEKKNVWDVADGILTIKKNSEGDWSYSLKNHGLDAKSVEDVQQAVHDLSESIGINEEVIYSWFQGMSVYNPGQFDLFSQAKEKFFEEVQQEFKLSGDNIDAESITTKLAPSIQNAFAIAYNGALNQGKDGSTALSDGIKAAIEYAAKNADISDPQIQESVKSVISGAVEDVVGKGLTDKQKEALGQSLEDAAAGRLDKLAPAIQKVFEDAYAGAMKEGADGETALSKGIQAAIEYASRNATIENDTMQEKLVGIINAAISESVGDGLSEDQKAALGTSINDIVKEYDTWKSGEDPIKKVVQNALQNPEEILKVEAIKETLEKPATTAMDDAVKKAMGEGADVWTQFQQAATAALQAAFAAGFDLNNPSFKAAFNDLMEEEAEKLGVDASQLKYEDIEANRQAVIAARKKDAQTRDWQSDFYMTEAEMDDAVALWKAQRDQQQQREMFESLFGTPEAFKQNLLEYSTELANSTTPQNTDEYEKVDSTIQGIMEGVNGIVDSWGQLDTSLNGSNESFNSLYQLILGWSSGVSSLPPEIAEFNDELGTAHAILQYIEQLLFGCKDAAGDLEVSADFDGAKEGAEEVGNAIDEVADEKNTEYTSNATEEQSKVGQLAAAIDSLHDKTVTITVNIQGSGGVSGLTATKEAEGTDYFEGGMAFVNDEPGGLNPELIVDKGDAFIVNGGKPALVSLNRGAKIFNADDTRDMLRGGGKIGIIPRFAEGNYHLEKKESGGGGKKNRNRDSGGGSSSDKDKNEWFDLLKEYMEELYEDAEAALDDQKEAINAQILALKYQTEAAEKANDLEEKRLEMVKAENDLLDAQHERTVRYFNAETNQWEWMADQKAVLEAQEALADAQKDYLDAQYDYLEDLWKKIEDEIDDYLEEKNDLDIEKIMNDLANSEAGSQLDAVNELIQAIKDFTSNPTSGLGLKDIASVYDSGGIATGIGFMPKGNAGKEVVLDGGLTGRILSPTQSGELTAFTQNLASLLDMSSAAANPQSMLNRLNNVTNNNGGNTFINGVRVGSEYMDRPLSEVLSVLGIYAANA